MAEIYERMFRAARLEPKLYEEVEADKGAMGQAMAVVVLSAVAAGLGNVGESGGVSGIVGITVAALIGWFVWAFLTYFIGTRLLPGPETSADMGQLLRATGFSSSPGLIRVLGIVPGLTSPVFFVAALWMLIAMVIAVRQALDYESTGRAIAVCAIGWLIQALVLVVAVLALSRS